MTTTKYYCSYSRHYYSIIINIKNKNDNERCVAKKQVFNKKEEERKKTKKFCVLNSSVISTGMFHSEEERDRTVDLIDELQHSYGSTTATNPTTTFEFDQITPCDIESIGFDFDCDFGPGESWGTNSSTCFTVGEPQYFTTFTPEDKWPI